MKAPKLFQTAVPFERLSTKLKVRFYDILGFISVDVIPNVCAGLEGTGGLAGTAGLGGGSTVGLAAKLPIDGFFGKIAGLAATGGPTFADGNIAGLCATGIGGVGGKTGTTTGSGIDGLGATTGSWGILDSDDESVLDKLR